MRVRPVRSRRDLRAFVALPYRLYRAEPLWVPPLRAEVRAMLSRKKNPFFDHGEAEYFLAERGGKVVGRIAAIANHLHNETHGDAVGFFGFFESIDDPAVAGELLAAAAGWCRDRGFRDLRGPASFSTNDECGLLVHGFGRPPTLMMPHNPPYYEALIEKAGFASLKNLDVFEGGDMPPPAHLEPFVRKVAARTGVTLRPIDLGNLQDELARIETVYNRAWERNWGFVPLTRREMRHLAVQLEPIAVADIAPMIELDGELIGFAVAVPDVNMALRANRSGRLVPGVARILWAQWRKKIWRIRILLLGLLPEFRGKGIDVLAYHWIWTKAWEHHTRWAEAGWVLEDNAPMKNGLRRLGFRPYKRYRLYQRSIV
jgi:GNAT superfamily N-acetyltransferase